MKAGVKEDPTGLQHVWYTKLIYSSEEGIISVVFSRTGWKGKHLQKIYQFSGKHFQKEQRGKSLIL